MNDSSKTTTGTRQGVAALFDDFERKELFRKYLMFLVWIEVLIIAVCWLYRLGDGVTEGAFPWRAYFLIAFLAPVAISFIVGIVIVGFNKYFGELEPHAESSASGESSAETPGEPGRIQQLDRMVTLLRKLPFLSLLLLLCVVVGFFYKLDSFLEFIAAVGEKSVQVVIIFIAALVGIASVFGLVLIVLNYQLRKRSMEYQYKSEMAQRFGLIILDDNTVLNNDGKLLVTGKKWKDSVPLLPAKTSETAKTDGAPVHLPPGRPDLETT